MIHGDFFNYSDTLKEKVICDLCGFDVPKVLSCRSKDGVSVLTSICRNCALIYINPRMTKEEYSRYYQSFYRLDRATKKNQDDPSLEKNFKEARVFGAAFACRFKNYIQPGLVLDVGSSTGGVLQGIRDEVSGVTLLGVEPSVAESEYAKRKGIETENCLFEDFLGKEKGIHPKNIFCIQSLNHLLSPRKFVEWSHETLDNGGFLFLAVKNFRQQVRRAGSLSSAVQIDHPYMFTPETLRVLVESVGFEIIQLETDEHKTKKERMAQRAAGLSTQHIRLVARKISSGRILPLGSRLRYWKIRISLYLVFIKLHHYCISRFR